LTPAEDLVAVIDLGLRGRRLSIGSRLVGDVLQWYDGRELHLLRGQVPPDGVRRRSFEFQLAADGTLARFIELSVEDFEKRFRGEFPAAPRGASARELAAWLRDHHGLWKPPFAAPGEPPASAGPVG